MGSSEWNRLRTGVNRIQGTVTDGIDPPTTAPSFCVPQCLVFTNGVSFPGRHLQPEIKGNEEVPVNCLPTSQRTNELLYVTGRCDNVAL